MQDVGGMEVQLSEVVQSEEVANAVNKGEGTVVDAEAM